jgi:prephenate dehydratase
MIVSIPEKLYHPLPMEKKIAYQGIFGSFSSVAARTLFGNTFTPVGTTRFREIFQHIARGSADYGVVPLENALAGSVHENYDLLAEFNCFVTAELYCPVQLHLLGLPGVKVEEIQRVVSHPKALEQCSHFLENHEAQMQQLVFSDTAGAAQHVQELNDPSLAAIASEEAAEHYGLSILSRSIQNHSLNSTRFVAVASSEGTTPEPTKCSLIVSLAHEPGSLYTLLGIIRSFDINLTKIESRPISGKPFEYAFHLDLACDIGQHPRLRACVEQVHTATLTCRVLGFYVAGH